MTRRSRILEGDLLWFPEERRAWVDYLARYGADPDRVLCPGIVIADDDARTIEWLEPVRDDAGGLVLDERGGPAARAHVVQLEAPALPFPDEHPDWPYP